MNGNGQAMLDEFLGSASVFSNTLTRLLDEHLAHAVDDEDPLTLPQVRLLGLLARGDGMRIADIAFLQCVSDAAASRGVERLVQRGLVSRTESKEDRRMVEVRLTEEGRALLKRYRGIVARSLDGALSGAGEDYLPQLTAVMDSLTTRLLDAIEDDSGVCFGCNLFFRENCVMKQRGGRICACAVAAGEIKLALDELDSP